MRTNVFDRLAARALGPSESERAAGFEVAASARRFSRRTQEVVDDKLTFSAALMRAGEVEAARRLLVEVEQEVLSEEAALFEAVNEVKVAQSLERPPVTRVRLARLVAVAMLSSSLLAFSAAGAAVVGLFRGEDRVINGDSRAPQRIDRPTRTRGNKAPNSRLINVAGIDVRMDDEQLRRYRELTEGDSVDEEGLETFLLGILPPDLADQVHSVLVAGTDLMPTEVAEDYKLLSGELEKKRRATMSSKPKKVGVSKTRQDRSDDGSNEDRSKNGSSGDDEEKEGDSSGGVLPLLEDNE